MTSNKKRAGVVGWPVEHSLSPRLHNYWLRQYRIHGTYEPFAVKLEQLKETLHTLCAQDFAGVNLTLPHKEAALKLVDIVDKHAKRAGAVNTIVMQEGKLKGSNTDMYGFTENLRSQQALEPGGHALVFGAGGAARAVCAGLLDEGYSIVLVNRTRTRADAIAQALGGGITVADWEEYPKEMQRSTLVVNTTSLGMTGQEPLHISLETLPAHTVVTDIVYNPLRTPLLEAAYARGNRTVDGLGMLLYQAQPGFEAWFGIKPEITRALREHVVAGLMS